MNKTYIFNDDSDSTEKILDLYFSGRKILCPRCKSELLILPDRDSAIAKMMKPGIYCPTNINHVCRWFITTSERREFWSRFHQEMSEEMQNE